MGFAYRSKNYWKGDDQCKTLHRNNLGKADTKKPLNFKDPLGFSKTVFIKTTYFEDDLVNYFFLKIKVSKHVKRSITLIRRTL